jgi:tartrate dehydratase alpha subunit/fumarate hydratase class I-like protein
MIETVNRHNGSKPVMLGIACWRDRGNTSGDLRIPLSELNECAFD